MRTPTIDMAIFKDRRDRLAKQIKGSALVIRSHPDYICNNDAHHPYRPDSNLFYLTGFEEPECVFVFRPGHTPESILFVRKKDSERETWDGFRYGPQGVEQFYGMDRGFLIDDFEKQIVELLKPVDKVYYRFGIDRDFDRVLIGALENTRVSYGRSGRGNLPLHDAWELMGELRVHKTESDLKFQRKACEITAETHCEIMRFVRAGLNERQIHGMIMASFMTQGSARQGYGSIVASGPAATTLHYVFNDQVCRDGDLLLVDAGAEYQYYSGDITRTIPVNGKFSEPQRKVYGGVLRVQKEILAMIKPGLPFAELQKTTIEKLTDLMIDLKLLSGTRSALIESQAYKKYYMHGVSHFLGLDVHDAGLYLIGGEPRKLEPGICFTVEPGIYIPANDLNAPAEFRGIGIRIEDDVVVTASGCENMTVRAPKEMDAIEAMMSEPARLVHL